jgi:sulfatase maturation enzyme AslB (radical SAM superfamily)
MQYLCIWTEEELNSINMTFYIVLLCCWHGICGEIALCDVSHCCTDNVLWERGRR